ncbi:YniB family protein [Halothiobacillus neapolitanus]|uniref:Putative yfeABCD locus regulator n=1 Tax=Halothiobacillus neapolitanus (strain ATCC 23641 / DSM 15147 / CIP 104769 / NCIMB 8539 / c2) TaxID=555778 RepID=D0KWF6_HALNC|nr:YniB family protein [Halothiobacillus neapolitanus]ACX94953.1 putative yfeABCD locus regulator [Halothiobacillus neapolitanus c2]TDN57203.1 YniB-like protein [Halothiobacillus neapolitanus]
MTYDEAKKKILIKWLVGAPVVVATSLSSAVSALKMFYFGLDSGDQLSSAIALPIKRLVYLIYENTFFLGFFWKHSPTPTPKELFATSNIAFFVIYLCIFFGMALVGSARSLSARLAEIDKEIENELIRESVKGNVPRRRQEIQEQVSVPKPGRLSQFHTLYLAPIVAGVVVLVIAKISGLG